MNTPNPKGQLVWVDLETSCIKPEDGQILEVAVLVTDHRVETIGYQSELISITTNIKSWEAWPRRVHTASGLIEDCTRYGRPIHEGEDQLIAYLTDILPEGYKPPLCGSSVHFDRAWMEAYMPRLLKLFSYRQVDVSTFFEMVCRSDKPMPALDTLPEQEGCHRAMEDILRSAEVMRRYMQDFGL